MTREEFDDLLSVADDLLPAALVDNWGEGYYYLHENGTTHWKPCFTVDLGFESWDDKFKFACLYFTGPFVQYWWYVYKTKDGKIRRTPNFYPQV